MSDDTPTWSSTGRLSGGGSVSGGGGSGGGGGGGGAGSGGNEPKGHAHTHALTNKPVYTYN